MRVQRFAALLALGAGAACAGNNPTLTTGDYGAKPSSAKGGQQFTRIVNATVARTVTATVSAFSDFGIPIATANEATGQVSSSQLQIRGTWGGEQASRRINCGTDSLGQDLADAGTTTVNVSATITGSPTGSLVALTANGSNPLSKRANGSGLTGCVLRTDFVTRILNDIEQKASAAAPAPVNPIARPAAPAPQPVQPTAQPATQPTDTTMQQQPRDSTKPQ
ncbi:MAG: hypothetical protein ABJD11_14315 [Gemmatimonadota bacterium]